MPRALRFTVTESVLSYVACAQYRRRREICARTSLPHAVYGLFIVSVGQLEDWLAQLGVVVAEKKDWLPAMFAAMGTDPSHSSYVKPGNDDVWVFLGGLGDGWKIRTERECQFEYRLARRPYRGGAPTPVGQDGSNAIEPTAGRRYVTSKWRRRETC